LVNDTIPDTVDWKLMRDFINAIRFL
jgi:hypothetical protein